MRAVTHTSCSPVTESRQQAVFSVIYIAGLLPDTASCVIRDQHLESTPRIMLLEQCQRVNRLIVYT